MRLLLKFSLPLSLFFTLLVALMRAQLYDDTDLRASLAPADRCPIGTPSIKIETNVQTNVSPKLPEIGYYCVHNIS